MSRSPALAALILSLFTTTAQAQNVLGQNLQPVPQPIAVSVSVSAETTPPPTLDELADLYAVYRNRPPAADPWVPHVGAGTLRDDLEVLGLLSPEVGEYYRKWGVEDEVDAGLRAFYWSVTHTGGGRPVARTERLEEAVRKEARRARTSLTKAARRAGLARGLEYSASAPDQDNVYVAWIVRAAKKMKHVPEVQRLPLLDALIQQLSGWFHASKTGSLAARPDGAAGIAMLTIRTAKKWKIDRYDPRDAVKGMGKVLDKAYKKEGGDLRKAVARFFGDPQRSAWARERVDAVVAAAVQRVESMPAPAAD